MAGLPSYDDNQIDTVRRTCPRCRREFFMRPWRFVCIECEEQEKPADEGKLFSDMNGVPMFDP